MSQFHTKRQTGIAIVLTLRAQANAILIEDLLKEGCHNVMTARFQIDALERRFSRNCQMSKGKFLVSLRETYSSENILFLQRVRREGSTSEKMRSVFSIIKLASWWILS